MLLGTWEVLGSEFCEFLRTVMIHSGGIEKMFIKEKEQKIILGVMLILMIISLGG